MVNKLLDVDKQARQILDEARQYYDRTISDIEAEKKKMAEEYEKRAKHHLEDIEYSEGAAVKEAADKNEKLYSRLTAEMDETFEKNRAAWVDELFNKCVGR